MKTRSKNKPSRKTGVAKKKQTKKIIVASVAVSAAGILGYFGWQYWKKKKEAKQGGDLDEILKPTSTSVSNDIAASKPAKIKAASASSFITAKSKTTNSSFPLKKGSKGENVRSLQKYLIAKYGKSVLPKYGADGSFGTEMVTALRKAGLPAIINESTFNALVQGSKSDNSSIGKDLYNAASEKNYNNAIALLKQIRSVEDYTSANEVFKQYRLDNVRQTIVNGLLNTFTNTAQKEAIKFEFLRMGLQFDGNKWSLSGFDGKPVVTTEAAMVWINATEGVKVPARMVLGNEVSRRLDYTLFENNGKYFLVNTKSVQYLN